MTTIRLVDARRGLNCKCEELFGNTKIAEAIYRFLCDGIDECEDAEPERKKGKWKEICSTQDWQFTYEHYRCTNCGLPSECAFRFCPNCGAQMEENDAEIH